MATITHHDDIENTYTEPIGRCSRYALVEESKYEEKLMSALFVPGEFISKKEPIKISEN